MSLNLKKKDNLSQEQLLNCGESFQNASLINSGIQENHPFAIIEKKNVCRFCQLSNTQVTLQRKILYFSREEGGGGRNSCP